MQDVTPWPESFDVSEPVARVIIDGQEVDVDSVEVSSELDSAMPERVAAGGGGVVAATGSASILRSDDVAEAGFNPWGDAQQFVKASEIVVEAGYRDPETGVVGRARQIAAQIESLDGGALAHGVNMEYVDYTPLLDQDITIEPLLQQYPSLEDWGPMRGAGLSPIYVTDRVLRHCGFYATPPMIPGALLSAPMMGSVIPERGTMTAAWAESDTSQSAAFRPVPWGMGLGNGVVSYEPNLGGRGHSRLTSPLHVSFHRFGSTSSSPSDARIELRWGAPEDAIRIMLLGDGTISVRYRVDGVQTSIASLHADDVSVSEFFTVIVEPSGDVRMYASNGATASGVGVLPPRAVNQDLDEIFVYVPQSSHPIGGLQVAFSEATNQPFQRTAHIDPPAYYYSLEAFPAQIKVNCLALLKEQAAAELAAMWIDEYGHFRWRNRHQLRDLAPRGTLTSQHDLLDLPWQVPVRSVFSQVEIEHDVATVTRRGVPSITVSENRGETLSNGDEEHRFFEPSTNQDWHQVEPPFWAPTVESATNWQLRRGRGSYRGGVVFRGEDDETGENARGDHLIQSWAQLNPQRWLLSSEARGLSSDAYIEQRFMDWNEYGRFQGENLPIIRCKGLVEWEPQTTTGSARGPRLAPTFTHQVGPWIQPTSGGSDELQSLADWLADYLTQPDVVLRDIPIVPDPRIQLGDTFWLEDQTAYHIRLKIVVMGKTLKYQATTSGHEMTQTITCRVIDLGYLKADYEELETHWAGRDYDEFESAWHDRDYIDLEADPLDRS